MKKLIAISITLALVTSAAFAQLGLSGTLYNKWTPFEGYDGDDATTSLKWWGDASVSGQTEDGKFGGKIRIVDGTSLDVVNWAEVWWQPIDMLKFQLGRHGDGWYEIANVAAWDFNSNANHFVAINDYHADAFAGGGLFKQGASFVITPLEGLKVVFGLPVFAKGEIFQEGKDGNGEQFNAMGVWKHFFLQAGYTLDNIGIITLTYKSGTQDWRSNITSPSASQIRDINEGQNGGPSEFAKYGDVSKIYASFQLKMIENLALHFSVNYNLPAQFKVGTKTGKINSPLNLGLGADYTAGDFGVKGRLAFLFLGNVDDGTDKTPIPFNFDVGVKPYYNLGIFTAYLNLGLQLVTDQENKDGDNIGDMHASWFVNPYIEKAVGQGTFFAGFQLYGKAVDDKTDGSTTAKKFKYDNKIGWAIPVGLMLAF